MRSRARPRRALHRELECAPLPNHPRPQPRSLRSPVLAARAVVVPARQRHTPYRWHQPHLVPQPRRGPHRLACMEPGPESIEEVWNDLKRRVYGRRPRSMEELERYVTEAWAATDLNFIARICRNMPHRLRCVIENGGHKI